ncbi:MULTISPECIES: alpha/beta fold hydrolase [Streptomyces]|uniref:alpha/beta fold hydrolase n=1 Tax=Streptomyces TaxID=1883 RepID=UPI00163CA9F4|nr:MULTISPECIES: alpha/beta hydrolase [Streptomyces]MBC2874161.1 alpha/beta hydrolase [Streptomyces sp. TYQ1024]UBI41327.1 alpha/beta hydrolase [Streptomyces mobaraensis]UKW33826.1 alpha/beta hydrolase [Streptomyces sp. TYQ1024]
MTDYLTLHGKRIAYDVTGEGPLVVLAHGMGDSRHAYRAMADGLVEAGYRVARVDLRGHGESDAGWGAWSRTAVAGDLVALVRRLGGPAVVVGHSFAGGAAVIAAAGEPGLVRAVVGIGPFTRAQPVDVGALVRDARHRKGLALLLGAAVFRSVGLWKRYLRHAHPTAVGPARLAALEAELRRPGRMAAVARMGMSAPTDAGARLADVRCPVLIVQGALDPDWPDPRAEGEGIVAELPPGLGRLEMIEGAGHYPHVECPDRVTAAVLAFLGLGEGVRA